MIPIAKTLQEAINHFANNNSPILCTTKKKEKTCMNLVEASLFFQNNSKKIRYKVTPIKKQFFKNVNVAIDYNGCRLYDGWDKIAVIFPINTNYPDTKQTLN